MLLFHDRASDIEPSSAGRVRLVVPVGLVILALLPRLLLHNFLDERSAMVLFAPAVMASAWFGGLKSGLVATFLSDLLGGYFVLRPYENLEGENLIDGLEVILFSATGLGISWMAEQLRMARRQAEERELKTKEAHQQITDILESVSDGFQSLDSDFRFVYLNAAAERFLGESRAGLQGQRIFDRFPELFGPDLESRFRDAVRSGQMAQFEYHFKPWDRWFRLNVYPSQAGGLSVYFSDINVAPPAKILSGLLPICASCKKIRDSEGTWRQIESYIRDHSGAEFSHSVCPQCVDRLYPELGKSI